MGRVSVHESCLVFHVFSGRVVFHVNIVNGNRHRGWRWRLLVVVVLFCFVF